MARGTTANTPADWTSSVVQESQTRNLPLEEAQLIPEKYLLHANLAWLATELFYLPQLNLSGACSDAKSVVACVLVLT